MFEQEHVRMFGMRVLNVRTFIPNVRTFKTPDVGDRALNVRTPLSDVRTFNAAGAPGGNSVEDIKSSIRAYGWSQNTSKRLHVESQHEIRRSSLTSWIRHRNHEIIIRCFGIANRPTKKAHLFARSIEKSTGQILPAHCCQPMSEIASPSDIKQHVDSSAIIKFSKLTMAAKLTITFDEDKYEVMLQEKSTSTPRTIVFWSLGPFPLPVEENAPAKKQKTALERVTAMTPRAITKKLEACGNPTKPQPARNQTAGDSQRLPDTKTSGGLSHSFKSRTPE
ncbi:hypothetical protein MRB53_020822 [Persea americana]|uniref:Uncharacterized protein n=1 Tax=Persea americana TaxID=3435 RepID=A0ACC2L2N7_PERAE|nr:hypothetical protein MRB53_020822 [Persea americana]